MILRALFLRPLVRAPLRFLATLLGISAGVAAFVATLASNRAALASLREDTRALAGAAQFEISSAALVPPEALPILRPLEADAELLPVIEELVLEPRSGAVLRLLGLDPLLDPRARGLAGEALGGDLALRTLRGEGVWIAEPLALTLGLRVGDDLGVEAHGRIFELRLLGTLPAARSDGPFATTIVADLALADRVAGRKGRLDRVELLARPGVDPRDLEREARALVPLGLELRSTGARAAQTQGLVRSLEFNLLALSGISLLVAGVLVATALATSVVQRSRTLALLVSLGAGRAALVSALVVEALALGLLGGLLGAFGGYAGAHAVVPAMRATLTTVVGSAPENPVRFEFDLVWLGLALGLVVAAASAVLPLFEILRTPPLQSLARERPDWLTPRARVGAVGVAILAALAAHELLRLPAWHGLPIAALGSATALLAALFALQGPLCDALARLAARIPRLLVLAGPLRLALAALAAGRRRSAWAAGAVGMSVALSVAIATLVHSFRTTVVEWTASSLRTDLQVRTLAPPGGVPLGTLDPEVAQICKRVFGAEAIDDYHAAAAEVDGRRITLTGANLDVVARRGGFGYRDGRDSREVLARAFAEHSAVVSESFALQFGRKEGDTLQVQTPGGTIERRIEGVYYDYGDSQGTVIVDLADFQPLYPARATHHVEVYLPADVDVEVARGQLLDALGGRFHVEVLTNAELRTNVLSIFDRTFAITNALVLVNAFVAVIAVLTVLFALLRERAADLALLRALGASRLELGAQVTLQSGLLGPWVPSRGRDGYCDRRDARHRCQLAELRLDARVPPALERDSGRARRGRTRLSRRGSRAGLARGACQHERRAPGGRMKFAASLACLALLSGWKQHASPFEAHFPADHGAHPEFKNEWWYATGELEAAGGEHFGYQLTVFRLGLEPGLPPEGESYWSARTLYSGHLALTHIGARTTRSAERSARANGGLAGARTDELDAWIGDWRIVRDPSTGTLHASGRAREIGVALELDLRPAKPAVLHGPDGLSPKGTQAGEASAYVSFTRLATSGHVTLDGRALEVTGESWFDHEWGSGQLGKDVVGWDWFGLRLTDGRELMIYRLRRAGGSVLPICAGTLVRKDGSSRPLASSEVELAVEERWKSPHTLAEYPARWKLSVPSEKLELHLCARAPDCEIDGSHSTGVVYWEGPVKVEGSASGGGYAELTGYAGSLEGRF
ncbi:MAG: FtsX-like permease family protein [Planctomycetes bacterium]|nr:FtsX-like permease family protein [Planctomycetota bacterium]